MSRTKAEMKPEVNHNAPFVNAHIPFRDLSTQEQEERRRTIQSKLSSMRENDRQKVKIRFKYYDCPGGEMKFVFKAYKQDPVEKYSLVDGQIYTLPIGVVRHLNKNCYYKIHEYVMNDRGVASQVVGKKIQRCEAVPLEFVDSEDLSAAGTDIVAVQHLL